jgi:voltage-gated potassium channel
MLSLLSLAVVGFIIAEIVGNLVLTKMKEIMGMRKCKMKNHTVICGWNSRGKTLVNELSACGEDIVVIAQKDPSLHDFDNIDYIKGDPTDLDVLEKSQFNIAEKVIVLADTSNGRSPDDADARTILIAMAIENTCQHIYTVIELLKPKNEALAKKAKVNEIILCDQLLADITAICASNQGIGKFLNDVLSVSDDKSSFGVEKDLKDTQGKTVKDVFDNLRSNGQIPIALLKKQPNPDLMPENSDTWVHEIAYDEGIEFPELAHVIVLEKNKK